MSGTRTQYARWKAIVSLLQQGGKITADSLAVDLEVSVRTIHRDLEVLRDDYHAPIEFDSSRRTYLLTESEWQLRPVQLTESELFHLVVAAGMAGQFHGTPIAKGLHQLFHKLEDVLKEPIDLDPNLIADKISFHGGHPRTISTSIWRTLVGVLRNHHVVRLHYQAAGYSHPVMRVVEPLHLACRMGDWYLLARREGANETRTYALSRVKSAESLRKCFSPNLSDSNHVARKSFARFFAQEGKRIKIRVRFTPASSEWIRERTWHPEQTILEHKDGGLTLAMPVDGDKEALSWVLGWGSQAKVLAPKWLKERVQKEARAMARS
ncbi:MAG: WYL domain-containing protein [Planctomycetota bacterium]